jgi:hypothetical protein
MRTRLAALDKRVTLLVPDPGCGVAVEEIECGDRYPKIVPRNGPEPGIIVQPAEIPDGHTLLLGAHAMDRAPDGHKAVLVLSLIVGQAPPCFGKIKRRGPPPNDPQLRLASPPRGSS